MPMLLPRSQPIGQVIAWAVWGDASAHPQPAFASECNAQSFLAENTGKSMERIMKDFDRDYWMDAPEAVEYGIVDKVINKI